MSLLKNHNSSNRFFKQPSAITSISSSLHDYDLFDRIFFNSINMPSFSKIVLALALFSSAIALPTPQLAGEGQAADSIFTSTDNGIGFGIKNAEDNTAATVRLHEAQNHRGAIR